MPRKPKLENKSLYKIRNIETGQFVVDAGYRVRHEPNEYTDDGHVGRTWNTLQGAKSYLLEIALNILDPSHEKYVWDRHKLYPKGDAFEPWLFETVKGKYEIVEFQMKEVGVYDPHV